MIQTITNNHADSVLDMIEGAKSSIKIVSPFITKSLAKKLADIVKSNTKLSCSFITRIYIEDMISKANSIEALEIMLSAGIRVYAVKGLHTKLYLFDEDKAILGSANFTFGGMKHNIELSLAMEDEEVISELQNYFDDLKSDIETDGNVTQELLFEVDSQLTKSYGGKKEKNSHTTSLKMYGADIGLISKLKKQDSEYIIKEVTSSQNEEDPVFEVFREMESNEQINYDHTIWLKFSGTGSDRTAGDKMADVFSLSTNNGELYLANYSRKPSVNDGDEVYFAPLTVDGRGKAQPVIIGRGVLRGFKSSNHASKEWIQKAPWMENWPWYCVIDECEILDTVNKDGIPLDSVLNELGSDTYVASYGKNESIQEVGSKHLQKNHIRLTGNAKEFIDKKFNKLVEKYGSKKVRSV